MVSPLNNSAGAITPNLANPQEKAQADKAQKSGGQESRVEQLKKAIEAGEYKVDLNKTSEKMALYLLG